MTEHARTAIRRLSIRGFRSIRAVDLDNIPDLVVLHGPNGSGKSNLLLAVQLVLLAAGSTANLLATRERPVALSLEQADQTLGLRPEDFHYPGGSEIGIAVDLSLGTRAVEILRAADVRLPALLSLEVVLQLLPGDKIGCCFSRADLDGAQIKEYVGQTGDEAHEGLPRVQWRLEALLPFLLRQLVQVSPAYRVPGGADDPEGKLYRKCLSSDRFERDAIRRLGRRLAGAALFGPGNEQITLIPIDDERYKEQHVLLTHPTHGELPLRNLGSGEQQLIYMLAQEVITPFPIAHVEEPEAHLHNSLMEPLAKILHESVTGDGGTPDVDQLWIATHHHRFAIAETYFDVSLDAQGATHVEPRPRDEAIKHFYEPHPYWETLRTLVEDERLDRETILVEDDAGPIRAKDVLSSIHGDRVVANRYVAAATRSLVLSLAQERRGK
jgi:energy-coupling factor transporter ATP-binding protein EcfA2